MHDPRDPLTRAAVDACFEWARERIDTIDPPIGRTAAPASLAAALDGAITPGGIGADAAMAIARGVITEYSVALDSPRFVALIPAAPALSAKAFDAVVAAMTYSPESWLEGAGPVAAENQVLRVLADAAGLPSGAGGCFVSGGSAANLAALAVARDAAHGVGSTIVVGATAHASVARAAHLLGMRLLDVDVDERGLLRGDSVADALDRADDVSAVVAAAGTTNAGTIDELDAIGEACRHHGVWFHIDAAYGGGALLAPSVRHRFAGIELADSIVIDPHKWLFSTLDCGALLYRDPTRAVPTFRQEASYLELLHTDDAWNPSDYAFHLTRRARGLPLWFALAVHGSDSFAAAIERVLDLARDAAGMIDRAPHLDLLIDPTLSVVLFARAGWDEADYLTWARRLLDEQIAFVVPTRWHGRVVARAVFLHPDTSLDVFSDVLAAMR